ncbi:hypothetical protein [aff. Roholtiella sp. LEGE 12411]|uniref:hypothetical protein n=1 Tax=aff. Roholtiella sp. LEGE 12411 TaxID=1828822 RepID=UPI00188087CD|nr:hypothetical protein [aff. Roholtiella sp. LEGE 12411]MBE9037845.1 hypothetical protein [aff. Roholtiella sp. LEGE 12411]
MKLIFLGTAFTASVLAGCSFQGLRSPNSSITSTPLAASTPSLTPSKVQRVARRDKRSPL